MNADRPADARWLLLLQQLPTTPAAPRVKLWRRLQQLGSIALRNSAYVLPNTEQAREDFEWLRAEIAAAGGQASIMAARALSSDEDFAVLQAFRDARSPEFQSVADGLAAALSAPIRRAPDRRAVEKMVRTAQQEIARLDDIDFGRAPNRMAAIDALNAVSARLDRSDQENDMTATLEKAPVAEYRGRKWVTRPRPGVDRMSSAWLIRTFVDPKARFEFREAVPKESRKLVPFDMFGVEFGHVGDRCTFEVLANRFGIKDEAVRRIGQIVHDADLRDSRYGHPEVSMINGIVEGLRRAHAEDHDLLNHGVAVFAGLYESFRSSGSSLRTSLRPKRRIARVRKG